MKFNNLKTVIAPLYVIAIIVAGLSGGLSPPVGSVMLMLLALPRQAPCSLWRGPTLTLSRASRRRAIIAYVADG